MNFEKKNNGSYEAELPIDFTVSDFMHGCNNLMVSSMKLVITNEVNIGPRMKLIIKLRQKNDIEPIAMWSLGSNERWPKSDLLEIVVDDVNIYNNLVLSEGSSVVFTNNDIDKYFTFITKANRDIARLKSWPFKNIIKDLYSQYLESKEVKMIMDSLRPKTNEPGVNNIIDSPIENKNIIKIDKSVYENIINYSELPREERMEVAKRLIFRPIWSHEEYRAVINYMRIKHSDMTKGPDKIQWKYAKYKKEVEVVDKPTGIKSTMAATVCYDSYTMEPIGFSGVYYRPSSQYGIIQNGIVMFVDPNYRRMGIAQTFYTIQEEKLRRAGVRYCYEIQIGGNVQLSDKNGYIKLSEGRLRNDGRYTQVRYLIDSEDTKSIDRWKNLKCNPIDWSKGLDKTFLKNNYKLDHGNSFTLEELNSPWRQ